MDKPRVKPLEWEMVSPNVYDALGIGILYRAIKRHDMTAPYRFDRYRNGTRMAEGIKVTKESCLADAVKVAVRLADPGDVLVYDAPLDALLKAEREKALREALDIIGMYDENATCSECCDVTAINEAVTALLSEDKTDG